MQSKRDRPVGGRREFLLQAAGAGVLGLALARPAATADSEKPGAKPLRGLFPIGQTPFTEDDKLDLDCLSAEVRFCNRGGVHGFAWPQIASGWKYLSERERLDGAEAILAAGKGGRTALVIGVQTQGLDLEGAVRYARHAARNGADALISLPPEKADDRTVIEYYKAVGTATDLPLFVQSYGQMSVDLVVEVFRQVPSVKCVKDEAGDPLQRVTGIRERTGDKLAVFSGNGARTMIDEMRLGFAGHCPTVGMADLFAAAYDLWHAGKRREAFEMFGRILAFNSLTGSAAYVLVARGIFHETTRSRPATAAAGRGRPTDEEKKAIREALGYLKPYLRG